jgi:hypothetical protein
MVLNPRKVLILRPGGRETPLSFFLRERHCTCLYAESSQEAEQLLREEAPALLLAESHSCGIAPQKLVELLLKVGTADAYCAHGVETGCWWLPMVVKGRACLGSPALRPSQFARVLDELIGPNSEEDAVASHRQPQFRGPIARVTYGSQAHVTPENFSGELMPALLNGE